jgi:hypothetical protein
MFDDGKVFRGLIFTDPTIIVPKDDVQDPVEPVFNAQCERTALANLAASAGSELMKYRVCSDVFPFTSRRDVTQPTELRSNQSG